MIYHRIGVIGPGLSWNLFVFFVIFCSTSMQLKPQIPRLSIDDQGIINDSPFTLRGDCG